MRNTNTVRNKTRAAAREGDQGTLIDEVIEAFGAMRGRGMRGIQNVRRGSLSMGHLQVLVRLQLGGPVPVRQVAEWLGVSAAGATGMVGRMEERGLIERVRDEQDRRVVLVRLASGGRALLDEIGSRGRASLRRVLERLDPRELTGLRNGLLAFQRAARELAEDERADDETATPAEDPVKTGSRDAAARDGRRSTDATGPEAPDAAEGPD